jgi:transcriptional regulator with XRE-family HTH domain
MADSPLATYLQRLFEQSDWTQAKLARASDLTTATIARLTNGERKGTDPDTTRAIAQALGMSHGELLAAVHGQPIPPTVEGESATEAAIRADPDLTTRQAEALITVYRSYRRARG